MKGEIGPRAVTHICIWDLMKAWSWLINRDRACQDISGPLRRLSGAKIVLYRLWLEDEDEECNLSDLLTS